MASTWFEFVRKIRVERGISYKEALKVASPLWKAQKKTPTRKTKKKKTYNPPEDVEDFPKHKPKPKDTLQKIPVTTATRVTDVGGALKQMKRKKHVRFNLKKKRR